MTDRLTPQREAETANRLADVRALLMHGGAKSGLIADYALDALTVAVRAETAAELAAVRAESDQLYSDLTGADLARWEEENDARRARVAAANARKRAATLRTERDEAREQLAKYVGHEPTIAEEMAYLSRCWNAVHDVCDDAEKQAKRWEQPLPVPEWVERVRAAATGEQTTVPRTERSYWVDIADALNAAERAGMAVGIDLDGTLTDHNAWSVIWDRDAKSWTVAGYDEEASR